MTTATEYQALVDKVEAFGADTSARRAKDLQCRKGCDACCHAWLTVGPVEAKQIRVGLSALDDAQRARIRTRGERELAREAAGASAARCALLEDDGCCALYAHRPLVCRSQGHALRYPSGFIPAQAIKLRTRGGDVTWCPLNYTEEGPRAEDILDAERVDQILAVVTRLGAPDGEAALQRSALSALAAASE